MSIWLMLWLIGVTEFSGETKVGLLHSEREMNEYTLWTTAVISGLQFVNQVNRWQATNVMQIEKMVRKGVM